MDSMELLMDIRERIARIETKLDAQRATNETFEIRFEKIEKTCLERHFGEGGGLSAKQKAAVLTGIAAIIAALGTSIAAAVSVFQ